MRERFIPTTDTLAALGLSEAELTPLESGLINTSWLATLPGRAPCVLQAVNPIFPPAINADIDIVTRHLEHHGVTTPRLIPLPGGSLWLEAQDTVWRLLTFMAGDTFECLPSPDHAREAGALLGRFHAALADFNYDFVNARLGVHDLDHHLAALRDALAKHTGHASFGTVEPLGSAILSLAASLPALPQSPDRTVHGDPKISNIIFAADSGKAICLIDLDTLSRMPLALELGDALRSWCNPAGEDSATATLNTVLYRSALAGYAGEAKLFITEAEWRGFPAATLRITVELAARFCADALEECYFGWDRDRFASASAHNQARATSQLHLAETIAAELARLEIETERAFS
jgi:Ser/Thr protein kinase RdoA (MazF antagonist)